MRVPGDAAKIRNDEVTAARLEGRLANIKGGQADPSNLKTSADGGECVSGWMWAWGSGD